MVPGLSNGLIAVSFGDDAIHHDQRQEKRAGASAELTNHSPLFSKLRISFHLESIPFLFSFLQQQPQHPMPACMTVVG